MCLNLIRWFILPFAVAFFFFSPKFSPIFARRVDKSAQLLKTKSISIYNKTVIYEISVMLPKATI